MVVFPTPPFGAKTMIVRPSLRGAKAATVPMWTSVRGPRGSGLTSQCRVKKTYGFLAAIIFTRENYGDWPLISFSTNAVTIVEDSAHPRVCLPQPPFERSRQARGATAAKPGLVWERQFPRA